MSTPPPPPPGTGDDPHGSGATSGQGDGPAQPPTGSSGYGPGDASGYGSGEASGYGGGGYQGAPGYYGGNPSGEQDNNLGVVALVTGIISILICSPLGIVAIIYGRKSQAAAASGTASNGTLGTVGFWLGVVALILMVLAIALLALGVISIGALSGASTSP